MTTSSDTDSSEDTSTSSSSNTSVGSRSYRCNHSRRRRYRRKRLRVSKKRKQRKRNDQQLKKSSGSKVSHLTITKANEGSPADTIVLCDKDPERNCSDNSKSEAEKNKSCSHRENDGTEKKDATISSKSGVDPQKPEPETINTGYSLSATMFPVRPPNPILPCHPHQYAPIPLWAPPQSFNTMTPYAERFRSQGEVYQNSGNISKN